MLQRPRTPRVARSEIWLGLAWCWIGILAAGVALLLHIRPSLTFGVGLGLGFVAYGWYVSTAKPRAPLDLMKGFLSEDDAPSRSVHDLAGWLFVILGIVVALAAVETVGWRWWWIAAGGTAAVFVIVTAVARLRSPRDGWGSG